MYVFDKRTTQRFFTVLLVTAFSQDETVNSKSWAGDIQCDDNPSSICGLEISFVSADIQDIDIKLIPVNQFCNINNPGILQSQSIFGSDGMLRAHWIFEFELSLNVSSQL